MMQIYIVTHKVPGYETRVCACYCTLEEAKAEVERLDAASSWASAGIESRELERPREWTDEQKRWMRGYGWTSERGTK